MLLGCELALPLPATVVLFVIGLPDFSLSMEIIEDSADDPTGSMLVRGDMRVTTDMEKRHTEHPTGGGGG